jgi:peptidoglycan hydrolase-like protein with peptidoglycan-binding domain
MVTQELERPQTQPPSGPPAAGHGPGGGGPDRGGDGGGPGRGGEHKRRTQIISLGVATVLVIAAAAAYAITHTGQPHKGGHKHGSRSATVSALKIVSLTPRAGASHVDGSSPVMVQFSAPLAAGSPKPVIRPAVAGTWGEIGDDATFTPARALPPRSRFTVRIPGGSDGVRTVGGGSLARSRVLHFTTRGYSPLRLSQLLGQLGYLPLTWSPTQSVAIRSQEHNYAGISQAALAYDPPPGAFSLQPGYPSMLSSIWQAGQQNLVLKGAIMAFQSQHGMTTNGTASPKLWSALFRAAKKNDRNTNGYTYAVASKALPETLTIWHNGHVVMRSLANTGIPVSPTVDGTFPVYQRFRFQIMRGTNPDGSSYADPVSYVSYFNGGDAVHYFPRGSYGSLQSLGCVELPYSSAEQAYPYLTYGSLVTVAG